MAYKVKLIKECVYGKAGRYMNPMDKDSYMYLYNEGLIEDEHNLIKNKTEKTEKKQEKKTEKIKTEKKDNNLKSK